MKSANISTRLASVSTINGIVAHQSQNAIDWDVVSGDYGGTLNDGHEGRTQRQLAAKPSQDLTVRSRPRSGHSSRHQKHFNPKKRIEKAARSTAPGSDQTSQQSRQALGLLIEAMLTAQHTRERLVATILPFPGSGRRNTKSY